MPKLTFVLVTFAEIRKQRNLKIKFDVWSIFFFSAVIKKTVEIIL